MESGYSARCKNLTDGKKETLHTSDICELDEDNKRYEKFRPKSVDNFQEKVAYGKIKTVKGVISMEKYWILAMAEDKESLSRLESDKKIRNPTARNNDKRREQLTNYTKAMERQAAKDAVAQKKRKLCEQSTGAQKIAASFKRMKEAEVTANKQVDCSLPTVEVTDKLDDINGRHEVDQNDDDLLESSITADEEGNKVDTAHQDGDKLNESVECMSCQELKFENEALKGKIAELEREVAQSLDGRVTAILTKGIGEIKELIATSSKPAAKLFSERSYVLPAFAEEEEDDNNEPSDETNMIPIGDNRKVKDKKLAEILSREEGLQWKITALVKTAFKREERPNLWLKVPKGSDDPNNRVFPSSCLLAFTEIINDFEARAFARRKENGLLLPNEVFQRLNTKQIKEKLKHSLHFFRHQQK